MKKRSILAALLCIGSATTAQDKGQLNVLCSVELEWCGLMSSSFERETGIEVNTVLNTVRKSTGSVKRRFTARRRLTAPSYSSNSINTLCGFSR